LRIYLQEQGYRYDVVDAVLSAKDPLVNLIDTFDRVAEVDKLVKTPGYKAFHESAIRLSRILKGHQVSGTISADLLSQEEEKELYNSINKIKDSFDSYDDLVSDLSRSIQAIEKFFDKVMVMDKDEQIKNNRLTMVNIADKKFKYLADFSKIVF
jgi:glycyl-tRNA synthetase beta chain